MDKSSPSSLSEKSQINSVLMNISGTIAELNPPQGTTYSSSDELLSAY